MLNKSYRSCFVGLNYISLLKGIVELKKGHSSIIIDESQYSFANQWFLNIGILEKNLISEIGKKYKVEPLTNFDKYLRQDSQLFVFDGVTLELSEDYFSNLKELARKFPQSFQDYFLMEVEHLDPQLINKEIEVLVDTISKNSLKSKTPEEIKNLFTLNQFYTSKIFEKFNDFIEDNSDLAKQLHYVMQMSYQNIFSNEIMELETKYLFLSLLGKRYKVDEPNLLDALIFEFRKLGGDIKSTQITDWGIQNDEVKYVLLKSIDGLIEIENCHYYGQLNLQKSFELRHSMVKYASIQLDYHFSHPYLEFFHDKRIICNESAKMGSDFPFWEFSVSHLGQLKGIYCYTDQLGTKPNFYFSHALRDFYQTLSRVFPGIDKDHWFANASLSKGLDCWHEFPGLSKKDLVPKNKNIDQSQYYFQNKKIRNMFFKGPERGQILGFYGYLVDLFTEV